MAIKKTADEIKYGLKAGASQAAINAAKVRASRNQPVSLVDNPTRTINIGGKQVTATTMKGQTFDPSKSARTGATLVGSTQTAPQLFTPNGVNPQTGYAAGSVADKQALAGKIAGKSFSGTTNYQSSPVATNSRDMDISIIKTQLQKQYANSGLSDAQIQRLAEKQFEALNRQNEVIRQAEAAYGQQNTEAQRFAEMEQRRLESEQRRLAQERNRAVRDYEQQIDPMFESSRQQAMREGSQRSSIQERLMGAQGNLTSQFAVQELGKIQQEVTSTIRAIDSEKEAKVELYRAQREGADAETISALMQGVSNARIAANNAKQQSITDLFNLRMQAEQIGDQNFMAWTEQLAEQMIADTDPMDLERSKAEGVWVYADGTPALDGNGKPMPFDSAWEKSGIVKSAGGAQNYAFVNPGTGEVKLVPLPAGDAPRSGGSGSPKLQLGELDGATVTYYVNPKGGVTAYYADGSEVPISQTSRIVKQGTGTTSETTNRSGGKL